ncbi:hypothetical protein [Cellulomonas gilvus]|uniref:BAAT/acyl-CoA thioester hydrolase n=1 Tax=Cellulomonas gilvus (strain ATCC 13127 / NRRL B-14078) TaxID=593907 RepID=F8A568_CELGA|nr:hypothetical protein [Cellulomonas gilvus]AEI13312.1 BAAT/acyl-CoA thioester hydrolase [Cellulomonas gilvus ATCC 13127]
MTGDAGVTGVTGLAGVTDVAALPEVTALPDVIAVTLVTTEEFSVRVGSLAPGDGVGCGARLDSSVGRARSSDRCVASSDGYADRWVASSDGADASSDGRAVRVVPAGVVVLDGVAGEPSGVDAARALPPATATAPRVPEMIQTERGS